MDRTELEKVREASEIEERISLLHEYGNCIETMVSRSHISPIRWFETPRSNGGVQSDSVEPVERFIDNLSLEAGEAILLHETYPERAKNIVGEGFGDPYNWSGEDNYHIPETIRHKKVFCWPYLFRLGTCDIRGATVVCKANIEGVHVSTYGSFGSLQNTEQYKEFEEQGFAHDVIPPKEYDRYHVFTYEEYLDWLEDKQEGPYCSEHILPYNRG